MANRSGRVYVVTGYRGKAAHTLRRKARRVKVQMVYGSKDEAQANHPLDGQVGQWLTVLAAEDLGIPTACWSRAALVKKWDYQGAPKRGGR